MSERPSVHCVVAKFVGARWQTRVILVEDAPAFIADGWLNFCRDPWDIDALQEWEHAEHVMKAQRTRWWSD
jgi:hypothetical protein